MSARLAFFVGRLRSQTHPIKPRAARKFRPKRYDKEYGAMQKEVGRNYASAAMIGNSACFQAATPQKSLGVRVLRLILSCPTGRRVFIVSGTIKDDLLVFGNLAYSAPKILQ
jgi:hypothetical protein